MFFLYRKSFHNPSWSTPRSPKWVCLRVRDWTGLPISPLPDLWRFPAQEAVSVQQGLKHYSYQNWEELGAHRFLHLYNCHIKLLTMTAAGAAPWHEEQEFWSDNHLSQSRAQPPSKETHFITYASNVFFSVTTNCLWHRGGYEGILG